MTVNKYVYNLIFVLVFFQPNIIKAQSPVNVDQSQLDSLSNILDRAEKVVLPSFAVFLSNLEKHASVSIFDTYRLEEKAELDALKIQWLNYLRVYANYQYGLNNSLITDVNDNQSIMGYAESASSSYGLGVSISIPLGDPFILRKKVKTQRAVLTRVEHQYEIAVEERKLVLLKAYNSAIKSMTLLKAKSETVAIYDAQIKLAEQDYIYGRIKASDLAVEKSRRTGAIVNYEEGRVELYESLVLLEIVSGIQLLNK